MYNENIDSETSARCREFLLADVGPRITVLDIGCGDGELMSELAARGCSASGVEIDRVLVEACQISGLRVTEGRAEDLPIADASIDLIVCSVVLPYTDERRAVAEWARVLKPGGAVNATFHGVGYGLDYLFHGPGWKRRFYGFRMLANTFFYGLFGRRLPGFVGDTLCQTERRMRSYYRKYGLDLESEQIVGVVLGSPQFICHRVVKIDDTFQTNK